MRRRNRHVAQPNDIAFLLIIFFLLLTGIEGGQGVSVSYGSDSEPQNSSVSIILPEDGSLPAISASDITNTGVIIKVPPGLSWEQTVSAMDYVKSFAPASIGLQPL